MAKVITENFRVSNANDFYSSLQTGNEYFVFGSSVDKANEIENTQKEKREFSRRVIFGNKIDDTNAKYIFTKVAWQSNKIYESFDDEKNIETTNMFVTVLDGQQGEGPYKVFKCIRNNDGAVSTSTPTTANLDVNNEVILPDGYVWKYMFDVPASEYLDYGITDALPYVANTEVSNNALETVSDILVENSITSQFSDYRVSATGDPARILSVEVDDPTENTYKIVIKIASSTTTKKTAGAYIGMYFRIVEPGQAEPIYDILNTSVDAGSDTTLNVFVESTTNLTTVSPSLTAKECDVVPKINVTPSTGTRCIAYGVLDENGTIDYVNFVDKGTEYKYANATVNFPTDLQGTENLNVLRTVISPIGGHGSNPVEEMYMSRIAIVTNFVSEVTSNIPETNNYTKVGLIKNPVFADANTIGETFDNRLEVTTANTDLTSTVSVNEFLVQEVSGEEISGRIHEVAYDANTDTSTLYLVDFDTNLINTFETGTADIKPTIDSDESSAVTINTVSDKKYIAYTGELLHFIDFDAIERQSDRKEKIKLIFDF